MRENKAPGTEFSPCFCAGIGPLGARCLAYLFLIVLISLDWLSSIFLSCIAAPVCDKRSVQVCDANCKDHLYSNCEPEVVQDCGCQDGQYIDETGFCVPKEECGCYDFSVPDKYIKPNEESGIGCMKWLVHSGYFLFYHNETSLYSFMLN